jgi:hypothetical protein
VKAIAYAALIEGHLPGLARAPVAFPRPYRVDGYAPPPGLGKLKIGKIGRKPFSAMFRKPN